MWYPSKGLFIPLLLTRWDMDRTACTMMAQSPSSLFLWNSHAMSINLSWFSQLFDFVSSRSCLLLLVHSLLVAVLPPVSPFASQPCPTPLSTASPDTELSEGQWGTDPSRDRHNKNCTFSTARHAKSHKRLCWPNGHSLWLCKGELSVKSRDLLWGIPWRVLAPTPAANS